MRSEWWFILLGYISFFLFIDLILGGGSIVEKKSKIDQETIRKITHIISSLLWIICYIFFGCSIHWVILNTIGFIGLGILAFTGGLSSFDKGSDKTSIGIFYFGLSTGIVAIITYIIGEEVYLYTGIVYYCLAIGDGFAPIVAKIAGKNNITIRDGKSLLGSLSVFLFSFISTVIFMLVFKMEMDWLFIFAIASLTAVVEFYGFKGLDNIFIEFAVFAFLLVHHYGLSNTAFEIAIIVSFPLALLAIKSKSLAVSGGATALAYLLMVTFFEKSIVFVVFSAALFLFEALVSAVSKKIREKQSGEKKEHSQRNAFQVIACGGITVLCCVLDYFFNNEIFIFIALLALVEEFSDSLCSGFGVLTKGKTIDILHFKEVEKGISGGISLFGTLVGLLTGFAFLLVPYFYGLITLPEYIVLSSLSFVGVMIDSVLGSGIQALYQCEVCQKLVEKKTHCESPTKMVKGFGWCDNVMVNAISGILISLVGAIVFVLFF